jgi:hypothetical protein
VIEGPVTPVPLSETARGEFTALLIRETLPDVFPAVCGANWSGTGIFWPAASETEDMPPTTLNPAPVMVAWEMITVDVPVLVRVSICRLLEPVRTLPKVKLVALAASEPVDAVFELVLAAGVPAPVTPVQPEMDRAARIVRIRASDASGARLFAAILPLA